MSLGNTNGSNFEVYALLGEVAGSGCPLGYLLIHSAVGSETGGKQRYLEEFLEYFQKKFKVQAIFTLTDKDMSEINAFLSKFPDAKHQLCFWHCLRAIKTRLSILRRRPKFYDVLEAKKEFSFVDTSFIPQRQEKEPKTKVSNIFLYLKNTRLICKFAATIHCPKVNSTANCST
jgi:hypothetical protein